MTRMNYNLQQRLNVIHERALALVDCLHRENAHNDRMFIIKNTNTHYLMQAGYIQGYRKGVDEHH